jgi:hypothetical protein
VFFLAPILFDWPLFSDFFFEFIGTYIYDVCLVYQIGESLSEDDFRPWNAISPKIVEKRSPWLSMSQ